MFETNKKEAGITIFGLVLSISKYEVMDVSAPVLMEPYRLIVPWPKEQSRLLAPIRPFQLMAINIISIILLHIYFMVFSF